MDTRWANVHSFVLNITYTYCQTSRSNFFPLHLVHLLDRPSTTCLEDQHQAQLHLLPKRQLRPPRHQTSRTCCFKLLPNVPRRILVRRLLILEPRRQLPRLCISRPTLHRSPHFSAHTKPLWCYSRLPIVDLVGRSSLRLRILRGRRVDLTWRL
jgi:hypothetical protein